VRILLLTGTRLRHFALAEMLAPHYQLDVVAETPRQTPVGGPAMAEYYWRMDAAEAGVFGMVALVDPYLREADQCSQLDVVGFGHVGHVQMDLNDIDRVVTFGCSWIKEPLLGQLVAKGAVNLHMGVAPYYRGTACNFWAAYDGHPEHVGYTVHKLTAGLDAGPILRAASAPESYDPFERGMRACQAGFAAVLDELASPSVPTPQDASKLIRYCKAKDFTEEICAAYLGRLG